MSLFLIRSISLSALIAISVQSESFAKNQQVKGSRVKGVHKAKSAPVTSRSSDGTDITALDRAPDMPGITYPNGKFLYGFNTQTKDGRNMGARFQVTDQATTIINYYRDSLKTGEWSINEQACNDHTLFATSKRFNSAVTITAYKSSKPGCEVYFTYGGK